MDKRPVKQVAAKDFAAKDEEIFSPEELRAVRAFYFQRLSEGERRILHAFEGPLQEDAPEEARLAAFAELRRSNALRDYIEAAEACRLADKAAALGLTIAPHERSHQERPRHEQPRHPRPQGEAGAP